ncbi:MAG: PilZ domain-containing protein [Bdellovibrionota bacterium]
MNKWFINANNFIKGPFSTEEIKDQMNSYNDQMQTTFLWSRGYSEWIRADKWNPEANAPAQAPNPVQRASLVEATYNPPPKNIFEKPGRTSKADVIEDIKAHSVEKFHVQYDFVDKGEMTKEELTTFTAKQEDISKISIFDKKDKEWKEIYSLPDIVQRLGLTRRENQRVPILAQFSGSLVGSGTKINSRVITISHNGMGVTDNFELKLGETIQGQLTSPHFYSPLTLTAEVTYSGLDGYVGLKFVNLNDEMQALVMDYIKRFGKDVDEK